MDCPKLYLLNEESMQLLKIAFVICAVVSSSSAMTISKAMAKSAGNGPYAVAMEEAGPIYARCIPEEKDGNKGLTQIMMVQKEGDKVVTSYDWYNRNGLVLGWSPVAGKVAVMRLRQEERLPQEKQIEFSFYLGDRLLRSYTTADLVKLGAGTELDAAAVERGINEFTKRAVYRVDGCRQVWNTNDYFFSVKLDATRTLAFDILTGDLCRIEKDGDRKQRLVHADSSDAIRNNTNSGPVVPADAEKPRH
jgi:hypothetical protein